jgi:hypothetical protein
MTRLAALRKHDGEAVRDDSATRSADSADDQPILKEGPVLVEPTGPICPEAWQEM